MKTNFASQKGSILPMFAVVVTVLIIIMAVAIDFARYVAVSEKLQTASDSAAVAGAMTAKRYVLIKLNRGREEVPCPPNVDDPCCDERACKDRITYIEGFEDDLIDRQGYLRYCCRCGGRPACDGSPIIIARWVVYEDGSRTVAAANRFFDLNRPEEMDAGAEGESYITSVRVNGSFGDPLYPSVVVKSRGRVKTLLMNFLDKMYPGTNASYLDASRCAQGGTFYYDLSW